MSIDGFHREHCQALRAFVPSTADWFYGGIHRLSRRLDVEVRQMENLPRGRALLVANHAFGWDVVFPMAAVWRAQRRCVWALGEHAWWRVPFVRRLVAAIGTVDGTPENVDRLLARDELVLVLPGGLREAVKPRELRYHMLWGDRYGFVRAAIRNRAPIVPLASIGPDEAFDFVGDAYLRGQRWLRRRGIPIPLPAHIFALPHLVPWRFVFGDPIAPDMPPACPDEATQVRRLRREVEGALHELIETELAQRAGLQVAHARRPPEL